MNYLKLIIGMIIKSKNTKYTYLMLVLMLVLSCEPAGTTESIVYNNSSDNITISFIPDSQEYLFYIKKGEFKTVLVDTDLGDGLLAIHLSTTITITSDSDSTKTFLRSNRHNEENSIFNIDSDYWTYEGSAHNYKYTYTITDEIFEDDNTE